MKISLITKLCFLIFIIVTSFKLTYSEALYEYKLKCNYTDSFDKVICENQDGELVKNPACKYMKDLDQKFDNPILHHFENQKLFLNYSNGFFKMYHSNDLKDRWSIKLSLVIKQIAKNIEMDYDIFDNNKARLMFNELNYFEVFDDQKYMYTQIFNKTQVNGDELLCYTENNGKFIHPLIFVDETKSKPRWFVVLTSKNHINKKDLGHNSKEVNYLNQNFLFYKMREERFWKFNLFIMKENEIT